MAHILIAEDDEFNQIVTEDILKLLFPGTTTVIADNGQEALERLSEEKFDLVLSDVDMPLVDGYELVRRIKNELKLEMPIICITAFAISGDREKLLMHGFDAYISKPVDIDEIRSVLGRYLGSEA